ncbi:MAG TPA: MBL fold metallo-hydrolase [Fibrobacteria bacterium]|nr:MBL fold metallo-hydrolase [Fibrobacteria bacterium]
MTEPIDVLHRPSCPVTLDCGGLELQGFSIGGLATYLMVPEWKLCFDMGECPIEAVRLSHVFLTHSHGDHARGLLRHFSLRRMLNIPPARYHVPDFLVQPLQNLAQAWCDLEGHRNRPEYIPDFVPLGKRDTIELNRQLRVSTFPVDHRVRSLGFTVQEIRKKLKPEFAGTPGHELGALKRQGVAIETETAQPRLTFIGDTTLRTLEKEPHCLDSDILVIETTFIMPDDVEMARPKGHLHLFELMDFLKADPDACRFQHIVLKHFSMKYTHGQIEAMVRRNTPDFLKDRVKILI